jgi:hypothetical protein
MPGMLMSVINCNAFPARQHIQSFIAAVCAHHVATKIFEHAREHVEHGFIIIDNQNCMTHGDHLPPS